MSAKRPAPYNIDQKTHQPLPQKQDNNKPSQNHDGSANDRQIFKVKPMAEAQTKQAPEQKPQEKGLIFAHLFNNNNGVGLFNNKGLFSSMQKKQADPISAAPIDFSSPNLFTGNGKLFPKPQIKKDAPNIFQNVGPSLFQNNAVPKPSLFQDAGKSIFSFGANNIPPVRAGEEDQEGDSAQLERAQQMKIDKSKSKSNYEYKEQMKVLFNSQAKKYKKNEGDLIENVEVIVQLKEETKVKVLVVRLTATKHSILNGVLVQEKTQIRFLNKKEQNVELYVLALHQGKSNKQKIKLQFQNAEIGKRFFQAVTTTNTHDNNQVRQEKEQKKEASQKKVEQSKQKKQ